ARAVRRGGGGTGGSARRPYGGGGTGPASGEAEGGSGTIPPSAVPDDGLRRRFRSLRRPRPRLGTASVGAGGSP
ncbi:hypothetical protein, partial [Bifidobacterium bifidum]|uniref:hypothetical protein n=1 Tax=Bifidobacterium bifidum TaxID=1681 RepID=UPI0019552629